MFALRLRKNRPGAWVLSLAARGAGLPLSQPRRRLIYNQNPKGDFMRTIFAAAVALSFLALPALAADPVAPAAAVAGGYVAKAGDPATVVEKPDGATALCKDGTWTKTHNHTGACASHKGVVRWLQDI